MTTLIRSLGRAVLCLLAAPLVFACVGTELTVPTNHPGHPRARSGKLPQTTGLSSDSEAGQKEPAAPGPEHSHAPKQVQP